MEKTHLMENAIYNELRRLGFNVDVGVVTVNGKDEISNRDENDMLFMSIYDFMMEAFIYSLTY